MIFFDYDGVLVDSLKLWIDACKFAAKKQDFCGNFPTNPYASINPVTSQEVAKNLGLNCVDFEKDANLYILKNQHNLKLFENTTKLLETLSGEYELYIMSATKREIIKKALENFGISQYFIEIYGGSDDTKGNKLKKFATKKALMIGDSISDIQAAQIANIFSIGVLWGWQNNEMLSNANILVNNHEELILQIRKYFENNTYN